MSAATDPHRGGTPLTPQQRAFVGLAFVVIVVVIALSRDGAAALLCVGALMVLFWAYAQQAGLLPRPPGAVGGGPPPPYGSSGPRERFDHSERTPATYPRNYYDEQAPAPYAAAAGSYPGAGPAPSLAYPGAIDADEYDTAAAYGYRDRTEGDNDIAAAGNPYNIGRVGAPAAAESCLDDEANDDELDGDERAVYQGRSRNDETRVIAGLMNRREIMKGYLEEECAESEAERWWGRHEV